MNLKVTSADTPENLSKPRFKKYRPVGDFLIIDDKLDPDRKIRTLFEENEVLSYEASAYRREIDLMEARLKVEKAKLDSQEAILYTHKSRCGEMAAKGAERGRELWLRLEQLDDLDGRQRWKVDRRKTDEMNQDQDRVDFLALVRTVDEDDEQVLQQKMFMKFLAEGIVNEEGFQKVIKQAGKKPPTDGTGHYI